MRKGVVHVGNLTVSDSIRLQTLQNRCARLVTGTLFRTPTNALLNDLGWQRLETRRLIHRLLFFIDFTTPSCTPNRRLFI